MQDFELISGADFDLILLAENRLGFPPLFYLKLPEIKDEWAIVLKIHALFEGALHRLLAEKIKLRRLPKTKLSDRDSFFTMLRTADELDLLDREDRSYLLELNHLRNCITHDLRFLNARLTKYVASISELQFQKAAKSLALGWADIRLDDDECRRRIPKMISMTMKAYPSAHRISTLRELFFNALPAIAIWSGGGKILETLSLQFHLEPVGDSLQSEPHMAATLQDLLLDPAVIEYKKELSRESGIDLL